MTAAASLVAEQHPADASAPGAEVWAALRDGSSHARETIFLHYRPYAQAVAANIYSGRYSRDVEFQDFQQLAYIGLLDSMMRFDPALGYSFKTFCTPRITGSVLDGIKRLSDAQEQLSLKRRLQRDRLNSLKEPDTRNRRLTDRLSELAVGLAIGHMLEGTGMFTNGQESIRQDGYEVLAWHQTCQALRQAVAALPPDMSKVIGYHYFHSLPFEHIAGMLGLSKGRISQIHRAGLGRLRESIQPRSHKK